MIHIGFKLVPLSFKVVGNLAKELLASKSRSLEVGPGKKVFELKRC